MSMTKKNEERMKSATIPVDYAMPVCELYMQTAQVLYNANGDVEFLGYVERSSLRGGKRSFDLPS